MRVYAAASRRERAAARRSACTRASSFMAGPTCYLALLLPRRADCVLAHSTYTRVGDYAPRYNALLAAIGCHASPPTVGPLGVASGEMGDSRMPRLTNWLEPIEPLRRLLPLASPCHAGTPLVCTSAVVVLWYIRWRRTTRHRHSTSAFSLHLPVARCVVSRISC